MSAQCHEKDYCLVAVVVESLFKKNPSPLAVVSLEGGEFGTVEEEMQLGETEFSCLFDSCIDELFADSPSPEIGLHIEGCEPWVDVLSRPEVILLQGNHPDRHILFDCNPGDGETVVACSFLVGLYHVIKSDIPLPVPLSIRPVGQKWCIGGEIL